MNNVSGIHNRAAGVSLRARVATVQSWRKPLVALLLLGLLACGSSPQSAPYSGIPETSVGLPDGSTIRAEVAISPEQVSRGLMFREQLAADRGMLFVFPDMQRRGFWMFQTRIPLDIIWLDQDRNIVYISADTPPCPSRNPGECPNYGGGVAAQFVLELAGGQAAARGLKVGDRLSF